MSCKASGEMQIVSCHKLSNHKGKRFLNAFIFHLHAFRLRMTDDQLMEVAEKSEVLDVDENYIGVEFARRCRNVIPKPEELKDK